MMTYQTADKIERDYDLMGVDLGNGFYGFLESIGDDHFGLALARVRQSKDLILLTKRSVFLLRDAISDMIEYMGWEEKYDAVE